jgi:hypothetical protein
MRRVPILNCMSIEKLSGVIRAVSCILEPNWKPILVESLSYEFRVPA